MTKKMMTKMAMIMKWVWIATVPAAVIFYSS